MTRRTTRTISIMAALLLFLGWSSVAAQAHSNQTTTTPVAGAVLASPPDSVSVRFDAPLMDIGTALVVRAADGTIVSGPTPEISRNTVSVPLSTDGPAGEYTVAYRIVSKDGHTLTSTFTYTVTSGTSGAPASGPPTPTPLETSAAPAPRADASGDSGPTALFITVGVVALLAILGGTIAFVTRKG